MLTHGNAQRVVRTLTLRSDKMREQCFEFIWLPVVGRQICRRLTLKSKCPGLDVGDKICLVKFVVLIPLTSF